MPEFSGLAQLVQKAGVGGGKGVFGKLDAGDPGEAVAQDGPGFVAQPAAMEEFQANGAPGIVMDQVLEQAEDLDFNAQFFAKLAVKALLKSLARLALAAGKFPKAAEVRPGGAAGDQEFSVAKNQTGGHFNRSLRRRRSPRRARLHFRPMHL